MAIITGLERTGKNKGNMYRLFVDDDEIALVHIESIVKNGLFVGKEVALESLREVLTESSKIVAFEQALKYLAKSMKTEREVCDNLRQKGFDSEVIEYVSTKLREYNYLNDDSYAKYYINNSPTKGMYRLKAELKVKGVEDKVIQALIDEVDADDERAKIDRLVEKYMRNKDCDQKNLQKLYQYLARRGFGNDDIMSAINRLKEDV